MIGIPVFKVKVRCHISLSKCPDMEVDGNCVFGRLAPIGLADVKPAYNPVG
jgi:hypothetical protein